MSPPNVIYLQWHGDEKDPDPDENVVVSEVSWCLHRVFDADLEYILNEPQGFDSPSNAGERCWHDWYRDHVRGDWYCAKCKCRTLKQWQYKAEEDAE